VEAALKALEEAVRSYNLLAHSLALVPSSAKRADGAAYEITLDRGAAAPQDLVNIDLKVGVVVGGGGVRFVWRGVREGGRVTGVQQFPWCWTQAEGGRGGGRPAHRLHDGIHSGRPV
jgi:hypothetical protein